MRDESALSHDEASATLRAAAIISRDIFAGDAIARPLIDALDTEKGRARDLSSLWVLASSAALFSQTVKERYLELLPNRMITDAIGSSETGFGGSGQGGSGGTGGDG